MQENLDKWRLQIREIDAEMIRMTAERMELAKKIGQYKADNQLPVKDYRVEKEIIERTRSFARTLGLSADFAEAFMTLIMSQSVKEQTELHRSHKQAAPSLLKDVLIVGGLGRMGLWFSQYFQSLGFEVAIYDIKSSDLPDFARRHENLEQDLDRYEVIFLCTPIEATQTLLRTIAQCQPKGLVIESSSLKSPVKAEVQALLQAGVRTASIHPMFGPDTDLLFDKNILVCTAPGLCSEEAARTYFHATSAELVEIPFDEHDRTVRTTLGLSHLINILFGMTLASEGIDDEFATKRAGSTFHAQRKITDRLIQENAELTFAIQALNPHSPELFDKILANLSRLKQIVSEKNADIFTKIIADTRIYLGTQKS